MGNCLFIALMLLSLQPAAPVRACTMYPVEPTVITEKYIRSGRAEKTLKLPGILPPEAPVQQGAAKSTDAASTKDAGSVEQKSKAHSTQDDSTEAPRDINFFQVKPTVINERYYTSGRAEKTLKLTGVLPADAPIPDSF